MTLCQCGCGQEVKPGNRFLRGHYWKGRYLSDRTKRKMSKVRKGKIFSKESRERMSKAGKGRVFSKEHKEKLSESKKGHIVSKETRKKISESSIIHGRDSILNYHKKHKKQECLFGCRSEYYILHHEPPIEDILTWEGELVNLCKSCHMKVHYHSLKLPDSVGVMWTKEDTEKVLRGE